MAKVLKFWHTWSWLFHVCVWLIGGTAFVVTYENATAKNTKDIQAIIDLKLPERMAKQEQLTQDIGENLKDIKVVQGKIFDRINQLADRGHQ